MSIDEQQVRDKFTLRSDTELLEDFYYWAKSLSYWEQSQENMNYRELPDCLVITKGALEASKATVEIIKTIILERMSDRL